MLTDEEIKDIWLSLPCDENHIEEFAREIERAVLAKAMQKQEPAGYMVRGNFFYSKSEAERSAEHITANHENCEVDAVYIGSVPAQAAVIPEGYALAPLEPTRSMLDAGVAMALQVSVHGEGGWSKYLSGLYKQMLSASPKPEQEAKKDCCEGGQHWGHSYDCKNVID